MTIYRVNPDDVETYSVITHAPRHFSSSSTGTTGDLYVYPNRSTVEKDIFAYNDDTIDEVSVQAAEKAMQNAGKIARISRTPLANASFHGYVNSYMQQVNSVAASAKQRHKLTIKRWTPTTRFTELTARKLVIKNLLSRFYRISYPTAHWAYTNYNTLNFFTSDTVPGGSALLYPNTEVGITNTGYVTGAYAPASAFSFDFYINPRYLPQNNDSELPVGTVLHLSSTYAVSVAPGSERDVNGRVNTFRLKLQLSHSADQSPQTSLPGAFPHDLTFLSDDNVLKWNNWHHVVIRWGTTNINDGSGSFNIDGVDRGSFVAPYTTIAPKSFGTSGNPDVLVLGNYYEGTNEGNNATALFFAINPAQREGLVSLIDDGGTYNEPDVYNFSCPLNAELHDVAIKRYYMTDVDIAASASIGPSSIDARTIAFYVPPFFTQEAPFKQFVGDHGGVLQTPFFETDGSTEDPFNVAMSFGVAGHDINLENFVKDFANNVHPRLHQLTSSAILTTTDALSANEFLFKDPQHVKRCLTILPCDDGNFVPNFELLLSESRRSKLVNDLGYQDPSLIHLDNLLGTGSAVFNTSFEGNDTVQKNVDDVEQFVNEQIGFTPENPGLQPGPALLHYISNTAKTIVSDTYDPAVAANTPLTIYNRTKDDSSNQVSFFDISNLFYGDRVQPGTLKIIDSEYSGSGVVRLTLSDDGYGSLYRSDCFTTPATWNNVGNVFYDEGVVSIKSPHIYFFAKEHFDMEFRGTRSVNVLNILSIADRSHLNSSSNPNWLYTSASNIVTDPDQGHVNLTGMYFMDDNFNVVAKTSFAQPITKRFNSRLAVKTRIDF
jgi:hypothetical protein